MQVPVEQDSNVLEEELISPVLELNFSFRTLLEALTSPIV